MSRGLFFKGFPEKIGAKVRARYCVVGKAQGDNVAFAVKRRHCGGDMPEVMM